MTGTLQGPGRQRSILAFTAGAMIIIIAFWYAIYRPSMAELQQLRAQTTTTKSSLGAVSEIQGRHASVAAAHSEATSHAEEVLSQFPRPDDLPAIMAAVDAVAKKHGARIELVDYAQIQWEKVLGRIQVTAVFSGEFVNLAAVVVDLPRVLPATRLEQLRFTAERRQRADTGSRSPADSSGAGTVASVASTLRRAFGLDRAVPAEEPGTTSTQLSPLHVDHLEAYVVFTLWLAAGHQPAPGSQDTGDDKDSPAPATSSSQLVAMLGERGRWYPRPMGGLSLPGGDPFRPSARALELVDLAQLVERYKDIKVTGIARSASRYVATVDFLGQSLKVQPEDYIGEARVVAVDESGVTLQIAGRTIPIEFGARAWPPDL